MSSPLSRYACSVAIKIIQPPLQMRLMCKVYNFQVYFALPCSETNLFLSAYRSVFFRAKLFFGTKSDQKNPAILAFGYYLFYVIHRVE